MLKPESCILNVRDMDMITISAPSRHVNILPNDDVDNSKIVENVNVPSENTSVIEDVYVPSKISGVIEDPLVNLSAPISDKSHVSSADISNNVDVLVESITHIIDETYIYEDDQEIQETKIESTIVTSSMSSSSESLEFLALLHQVSSGVFSFSGCLKFFPEFLQIFVSLSDVILLAVSEIRLLGNSCFSFLYLYELLLVS